MNGKNDLNKRVPLTRRASLALESVLVFPLVLMIMLAFVAMIRGEQNALILSHALNQTGKEIALLLPLADIVEKVADPEKYIKKWIPNKTLAGIALDGLSDVAATVLVSPFVLNRVDTWAEEISRAQHREPPACAKRLAIDIDNGSRSVWLVLSFQKTTPLGHWMDTVRARIPIWNASLFREPGETENENNSDGIWELSNFERGIVFRKKFGGHLPQFYPVIAAWNGSEAVSIKSMDLTAPSYSEPILAERRLNRCISELASFEGAGGEGPAPGSIRRRRLILIIPDNDIPWKSRPLLESWRTSAAQQGVVLDIRTCGTSHAHENG